MENEKTTCYLCDSIEIVNWACQKCGNQYCAQCASKKIPLLYCFDCMAIEVKVEDPYIVVKTDWDEETGETVVKKSRCKRMHIDGADWFFHERYMTTLTEDEKRDMLILCRAQVSYLENEIDAVNVRRRQEQVAQVTGHNPQRIIAAKHRDKKLPTIQDIQSNMQKLMTVSGLTMEQIAQLLGMPVK